MSDYHLDRFLRFAIASIAHETAIIMTSARSSPNKTSPAKKKVGILPSISEKTADCFYWVGNMLLLLTALTGVIGAAAVLWGDRVRDYFSDQRIAENEAKTATANQAAADANKIAAQANERAAEANNQAAQARERAANAELALEELKAPRKLLAAQRAKMRPLITALGKQNFVIAVVGFGDNEATNYAQDIAAFLRDDCSWSGTVYMGFSPGETGYQIHSGVDVTSGPENIRATTRTGVMWELPFKVRKIFEDAGIAMANGATISLKDGAPAPMDTLLILVGPKPRPEEESSVNPWSYKPK